MDASGSMRSVCGSSGFSFTASRGSFADPMARGRKGAEGAEGARGLRVKVKVKNLDD